MEDLWINVRLYACVISIHVWQKYNELIWILTQGYYIHSFFDPSKISQFRIIAKKTADCSLVAIVLGKIWKVTHR